MLPRRLLAALCLNLLGDAVPATADQIDLCRHTKVVVLGAGAAGIGAAKELARQNVTDFVILGK